MIETWREFLYPLGFLATFAFFSRFVIQWLYSEKRQSSIVPPLFWQISLAGNALLLIHAIIQAQVHVALIQAINGVISWRNLNLMQPPIAHATFRHVLRLFAFFTLAVLGLFFLQAALLQEFSWFRVPAWFYGERKLVPLYWHMFGFFSLAAFNSRFWVQWWLAEKHKTSTLGLSFWWMSLIGDLFCLLYFLRFSDYVQILGPLFSLIPYIRNLTLQYKQLKQKKMA